MEKILLNNGDISIPIGESVIGLDIKLSGVYELEYITRNNFYINYNKNRIIGVGLGSNLGTSTFLKYTGDLRIVNCKVVKQNLEELELLPFYEIDRFEKVFSTFDGVQENIENMKKNNVFGEIPQRIKTTFQNKIYDKDGKKIDVNKSTSKKLSRTTRRTMGNLRTMSATEGSY
tara:strand:+ start:284 stop:805 length:522 start_codon:yes stop_codon:yes gene_type:complete